MERKIVLGEDEITSICERVGREIDETIKNDEKPPVLVGVLKGSVPFLTDLSKHIKTDLHVDFIQIKSYDGTSSSGQVCLLKDVSFDCEDRTVIIVEDIVDTGLSMNYLLNHFKSHNPKKVYVCALFDKKNARKVPVQIDFVGKVIEGNDFLLGYGLDYKELCRNLPYVYAATKEDIERLDNILNKE